MTGITRTARRDDSLQQASCCSVSLRPIQAARKTHRRTALRWSIRPLTSRSGNPSPRVTCWPEFRGKIPTAAAAGWFRRPRGFSGSPSRGGRGLGSGAGSTEILINGKRNAGKNNSTQQMLQRIASSQVQEIQIIRGTSGDLDVRGSGQIINVVLFEELSSNSFSYQGSLNYSQDDAMQPGGTFAVNGQRGALDFTMTLRSQPRYRNSLNNESSILGDFPRTIPSLRKSPLMAGTMN